MCSADTVSFNPNSRFILLHLKPGQTVKQLTAFLSRGLVVGLFARADSERITAAYHFWERDGLDRRVLAEILQEFINLVDFLKSCPAPAERFLL
jgi:hypothetical protein